MILASLILFACSTDPDPVLQNQPDQISQNMVLGSWKISYFSDSGKDETNHFAGYGFVFSKDKIINANNGSTTLRGSWSITGSRSNDDSPGDMHLNIVFSSPDKFEDLSEDWEFISVSENKMELIHVSGGNGGTDFLTFER